MDYAAFLKEFGFPLTALVLVLVTGMTRKWVWARELDAAERALAAAEARHKNERERAEARHKGEQERLDATWRERYRELQEDCLARLEKSDAFGKRYEALVLRLSGVAETAAQALDKAVHKP